MSLKVALERLLGAPCYHTSELFRSVEHAPTWRDALHGKLPDWEMLLSGYAAGVDWPVAWFWRELADAYPDAVVVLSRRDSAETWHRSMDETVLKERRESLRVGKGWWEEASTLPPPEQRPGWAANATLEQARAVGETFQLMNGTVFADPDDREGHMAAYEQHLSEVRSTIRGARLVEWQPGDGWEPLCTGLGLPIPDEPFPHENSTSAYDTRRKTLAEPRPPR
jgi:Sulfotransferase domain